MKFWQGILITVGVVIVALIVYDKFVKGKIGKVATS